MIAPPNPTLLPKLSLTIQYVFILAFAFILGTVSRASISENHPERALICEPIDGVMSLSI